MDNFFALFNTEGSEQLALSGVDKNMQGVPGAKISIATYNNNYKVQTEVQPSDFSTLQTIKDVKYDVNAYEKNTITRYNSEAMKVQYGIDFTTKNCYKSGKIIEDPNQRSRYLHQYGWSQNYIFSHDFQSYKSEAIGKRSLVPIELYGDEASIFCENVDREMENSTSIFGNLGKLHFETKTIDGKRKIYDVTSSNTYQVLLASEHQSGGRYLLTLRARSQKLIPEYDNLDEKTGIKILPEYNPCSNFVASISGSQVSSSSFYEKKYTGGDCYAHFQLRPQGIGEYKYLVNISSKSNGLFGLGLDIAGLEWIPDQD
jgi:hypothetical protein